MSIPKNPFELHTITPYIIVNNAKRLIEFLQEVFHAESRGDIHYREDETVQHAELKIGDSVIMIGEPMSNIETTTTGLYVYVDDCDVRYKKSLDAGSVSILEPTNFPHGDRYGGVKDFAGNVWWIVTHVGK